MKERKNEQVHQMFHALIAISQYFKIDKRLDHMLSHAFVDKNLTIGCVNGPVYVSSALEIKIVKSFLSTAPSGLTLFPV